MQTEIFFAFPDKTLRYDCVECDQRCCKTGGLAVLPAERNTLLTRHPGLELVTPSPPGGVEIFTTPMSGCWFLEDAKCSLASTNLQPAACQMFPFNMFGMLENTLVVAPNGLCPLVIAPGEGHGHEDLAQQLGTLGAAGAAPQMIERPEGAIALERLIANAAAGSLMEESFVPLIAFSAIAGEAFRAQGANALLNLSLAQLPARIASLADQVDSEANQLGISVPSDESIITVAPLLAAWTPSIRLFGFDASDFHELPMIMLRLGLHLAHWQSLRPERRLLPQTLLQMVSALRPNLVGINKPS